MVGQMMLYVAAAMTGAQGGGPRGSYRTGQRWNSHDADPGGKQRDRGGLASIQPGTGQSDRVQDSHICLKGLCDCLWGG